MRTGGWLRGIAHTLETADQRRAMRSAANRSSAASNAATGNAEGRLPASGAAKSRAVATTGMGMRGSRSGAFNYSRRTIPPLVSFGDYIYGYLFAFPHPFHARCFHRSAAYLSVPTPFAALALKSLDETRKERDVAGRARCREVSRTTCRNVVVPLWTSTWIFWKRALQLCR